MKSRHAEIRMKQRAIPQLMFDLVRRHGRQERQNGSSIRYLDKRGRKRALKELQDAIERFEKCADTYIVESSEDGTAITVGHRTKRIRRR